MRIPIVLTVGLALTALAVALLLTRSPLVLLRANSAQAERTIAGVQSNSPICQANEVLPRGTSAIRVALGSSYGPKITVKAQVGDHVITEGSRGSEWVGAVAVPVKHVARTYNNVTLCLNFGAVTEGTGLNGKPTAPGIAATRDGKALAGRARIEYLHRSNRSWASMASSIAHRIGLGHAPGGTWLVFPALALMLSLATLTSRTLIRDLK